MYRQFCVSKRFLIGLIVLIPWAYFVGTGLNGLDFGKHWDERHAQELPVKQMLEKEILLPGYYQYPSLNYWVILAATLPTGLSAKLSGTNRMWHAMKEAIHGWDLRMQLRLTFLLLSSLVLLWVFFWVKADQKSVWEALLATTVLASSWELSYHSRWVATDTLLVQFVGLCLLLLIKAYRSFDSQKWLLFAAIAGGLGCATKYPGGLLIVPIALAAFVCWHRGRCGIGIFAWVNLLFFGTFLVVTPGAVLEFPKFVGWIRYNMIHYGSAGHWGYTVQSGFTHLRLLLEYFATTALSFQPVLALILSALVLTGAFSLIRKDKVLCLIVLSFPVLYVLYFSQQVVLIVRNVLVILPFLAVLSARGTRVLFEAFQPAVLRLASVAGVLVIIGWNSWWLWETSESIATRDQKQNIVAQSKSYLETQTAIPTFFSKTAKSYLNQSESTGVSFEKAELIVLKRSDIDNPDYWPANHRTQFVRWFGPHSANLNYYPTWPNHQNVVLVMEKKMFEELGLAFRSTTPSSRPEKPKGESLG